MKWRRVAWPVAAVAALAIGATLAVAVPSLPASREEIPTTTVVHGTLKLTVYATGDLRAGRSATLVSPPAGGMLRIVTLLTTGTPVKKDQIVVEFDPADQEFVLEQAKSDLAEAEQQIVKAKSDSAVQAAQDQVDLLTARYDVRRAELDIAANEFVGEIDAQKNVLSLEEAKRRLEQLEQDVKARSATNQAALAVQEEARHKARLAIQRANTQIDSLVLKAPMDGVVSVKENRDVTNMFFTGMILPEYRQGDSAFSGRSIADVIEDGRMELRAKINEIDRDNLQTGEAAKVQIDMLPGETFIARVGTLAGLASRGNFWESNSTRQFDVAFQFRTQIVGERIRRAGEIDADGMIDHQFSGNDRIDPARQRGDISRGDRHAVLVPHQILQQHFQRDRHAVERDPKRGQTVETNVALGRAQRLKRIYHV